jgi:hypothetical protein
MFIDNGVHLFEINYWFHRIISKTLNLFGFDFPVL